MRMCALVCVCQRHEFIAVNHDLGAGAGMPEVDLSTVTIQHCDDNINVQKL